jgi:2-phosphosulfolactate phosphatase
VCTDFTGEDQACAMHLAALLAGGTPDAHATRIRIGAAARRHIEVWRQFHTPAAWRAFRADVDACSAIDAYGFAMIGRVHGTCVELRAVPVAAQAAPAHD